MSLLQETLEVVYRTLQYHATLNPAIWTGDTLQSSVRTRLLTIARQFIKTIGPYATHVTDITLTGSNANFNWTIYSDFDLHIIVDKSNVVNLYPDDETPIFDSYRQEWNKTHKIHIKGFPVEVYLQDAKEPHYSTGVFSLLHNSWVVKPNRNSPEFHKSSIEAKAKAFMHDIDSVYDPLYLIVLKNKIMQLRRAGLERAGEFSSENLVFKVLRNSGHIERLLGKLKPAIP